MWPKNLEEQARKIVREELVRTLRRIGPFHYSHYIAVDGPHIIDKSCKLTLPWYARDDRRVEPMKKDPDIMLRNTIAERINSALWPLVQAADKVRVIVSFNGNGERRWRWWERLVGRSYRIDYSMAVSE